MCDHIICLGKRIYIFFLLFVGCCFLLSVYTVSGVTNATAVVEIGARIKHISHAVLKTL